LDKRSFTRYSVVFATVYFFSSNGLGALPNLSLSFLLKEKLGLGPSQLAYFLAVTHLAWIVKPLWGYISDSVPLFGSRRRSYLVLSSAFAAIIWGCLAAVQEHTVANLLALVTVSYLAYAFQDVVADGLMVEVGKPAGLTGRFQAIQWGAVYLAMILTAFGGGQISDLARNGAVSYRTIFGVTAVFPLVTMLVAFFLIRESKTERTPEEATAGIRSIFRKKDLWILSGFLFFWNFSPSINSAFFYYAVDTLKFDGAFIGLLQAVAAFAAFLGSFLFKYAERVPVRRFLLWAALLGTASVLSTFVYFMPAVIADPSLSKTIALSTNFFFGLLSTQIFLTLLNLAAKVSPQYAGGTTFAFLMSFYNLGLLGSHALGGLLFNVVGFQGLIVLAALFSLSALLFLPYLPTGQGKADA
jgi:MFS family permease